MKEEYAKFDEKVECSIRRINMKYEGKIKELKHKADNIDGEVSYIVECSLINGLNFITRVTPRDDIFNSIEREIRIHDRVMYKGKLTTKDDDGIVEVYIGETKVEDIARNLYGQNVILSLK